MHPKSKQFQQLQADWYKKIKDRGFDDIEQPNGMLKEWHSRKLAVTRYNKTRDEATQEYYRLSTHFYNDYKFETILEENIWFLHSEGYSIRKIVQILIKKGFFTYKRMVNETIQRLRKEMTKLYGKRSSNK